MRDLPLIDMMLRFGVAAAAAMVLGLEREVRGHVAGVRTHVLVAVGATLFTVAGAYGFADLPHGPNVDPARIAAQVASGVGFLGAGAILRQGLGVRGLTTAATLWLAAAIGVACGAGAYDAALIGGGLVLLVLVLMRVMTPTLLRIANSTSVLEIEYERGHGTLGPLLRSVEEAKGRVEGLDVDDEDELRKVTMRLRAREAEELQAVVE